MHFKDKVVWITGASSGIGAELARQLARQKARLILTARSFEKLSAVKEACLIHTAQCELLPQDLSAAGIAKVVVDQAICIYGHIDVIIHAAGVSQRSLAVDTDISVYEQLMDINFFAPVRITQYLLPHFATHNGGHIIAVSSMAGLMGFPMRSGYAAAKHALKGYFETLQTEQSIAGLKITIVSPGRVNTPLSRSALTGDGHTYNADDRELQNGLPVATCAGKIIKAAASGKRHVLIAREEKILFALWWYIPRLYYKIAHKKGVPKGHPSP